MIPVPTRYRYYLNSSATWFLPILLAVAALRPAVLCCWAEKNSTTLNTASCCGLGGGARSDHSQNQMTSLKALAQCFNYSENVAQ